MPLRIFCDEHPYRHTRSAESHDDSRARLTNSVVILAQDAFSFKGANHSISIYPRLKSIGSLEELSSVKAA